jgi:arsenite/tail-anchored protein-transporting ATPase
LTPTPARQRSGRREIALPAQPLLLFAGKGGVGKTTAAAATALELLRRSKPPERILLFSTDPAHSLGDALRIEVGNDIVRVAGRGGSELLAYELDPQTALSRFKQKYGATLAEIFERGTFLDKQDIEGLMDLPLPGIDEAMCLLELSDLISGKQYSRILVDTAPTGHTLRFLRLPSVFTGWVEALNSMSDKHRYMALQLTGALRMDYVDRFLNEFASRAQVINRLLTDPKESAIVIVTIPEIVAYEETARYVAALGQNHNHVSHVVVNRVEDAQRACRYCRARARDQKPVLKKLGEQFSELSNIRVPVVPFSLAGLAALRKFGTLLWEGQAARNPGLEAVESRAAQAALTVSTKPGGPEKGFNLESRRWLIFGGKGGVGKTTASCAAALALADSNPKQKIMVFSSDPAHSLSDSFGESIGEFRSGVAGCPNLYGMEIDASARFAKIKGRYNAFLDQAFGNKNSGSRWTIEFDPEAMRGFLAAAPPGIDEILALTAIGDLLVGGDYHTIVVDSAPSGHLLRLLALPDVARSWIATLMKLLLKYKDVVRWNEFVEELLSLSKSLKSTVSLMTDPGATEFIGVATPELMSLDETERLSAELSILKVPMRRLLINNVTPEWPVATCSLCTSRLRQQKSCIGKFKKAFPGSVQLYSAPQQPRSVQGPDLLRTHFANWQRVV